ncbi:hypothetical protein T484DRAFT_1829911 [Baffinella frigidus]|nr:hypothetical protein T484DRAFT_1829911 [Cryptophyta sp. CCMP2293]
MTEVETANAALVNEKRDWESERQTANAALVNEKRDWESERQVLVEDFLVEKENLRAEFENERARLEARVHEIETEFEAAMEFELRRITPDRSLYENHDGRLSFDNR